MCNSKPTIPAPSTEAIPHDPAVQPANTISLNPRSKARLAELFMHNPQFAEAFFKARIGEEGMIRFNALRTHVRGMDDVGLKCITDSRLVGTLALLSRFFDTADPEAVHPQGTLSVNEEGRQAIDEGETDKVPGVKMNKWCWIFLGAWTVGEAGRVLESRKSESA